MNKEKKRCNPYKWKKVKRPTPVAYTTKGDCYGRPMWV